MKPAGPFGITEPLAMTASGSPEDRPGNLRHSHQLW
jgi:hypothetical protein